MRKDTYQIKTEKKTLMRLSLFTLHIKLYLYQTLRSSITCEKNISYKKKIDTTLCSIHQIKYVRKKELSLITHKLIIHC